ncbi:MAG TPA: serine/threonine-protein kinase [Polyangiales bacterium]
MSNTRLADTEQSALRALPGPQEKYRVIASLGQGGMANIFLAVMSGPARFSKLVVLKVLRDDLDANHDELVTMFLDEARLAACLQHRNIVHTYEFGEASGRYHMAMEYLEGQPLRALQRKLTPGGLPMHEELYVLAEASRGLHYAHELRGFDGTPLRVVHRDVSPQNVFVTYDGQVKLLDFGIAKTDGAEHLTKVGVIKGKVDYIAPEQVRGDAIDRRADIFSLGAMLWEAITKERFAGGTKIAEVTKFHKRLTGGEPKLRELVPNVPEELAQIVDRAIALDPNDRFPTAADFADAIETYLEGLADQPDEKSLAGLLAVRFDDERAKLRKLIEQQVQISQDKARRSENINSGSRPVDLTMTMSGMLDLSMVGSAPSARFTPPANDTLTLQPAPQAAPWKGPAMIAAALLLAGAAGAMLVGGKTSNAAAPAASAPAPAVAATEATRQPEAAPAPAERTVTLTVEASPPTAHVMLDGAPLPKLPFSGSFRQSDALHHLEASAEGYQAVRQLVTFEQDREIKIILVAQPPAARARPVKRPSAGHTEAAAPTPAAPSAPAASTPAFEPGGDLKVKVRHRKVDLEDPYAQ